MRGLSVRRRKKAQARRFTKRARHGPRRSFELHFELLRAYASRTGHSRVPVRQREGGFGLGQWVTRCRTRYRNDDLSPEQVRVLEGMPGWTWEPVEARFQEGLRLLRAFAQREGDARVPDRHREAGFPLGYWVRTRRQEYKQGRLSMSRVAALETLPGWSWHRHEDDFQKGLRALHSFVKRKGNAHVSDLHRERGFALGSWVRNRRREYRIGTLSLQRINALERIAGWRWSHWSAEFDEGLRRLKRYARREGHARVPARQGFGERRDQAAAATVYALPELLRLHRDVPTVTPVLPRANLA